LNGEWTHIHARVCMHAQRFAGAHAYVMHGHMRTRKCANRDVFIHKYIQTLEKTKRNTDTHTHTHTHSMFIS